MKRGIVRGIVVKPLFFFRFHRSSSWRSGQSLLRSSRCLLAMAFFFACFRSISRFSIANRYRRGGVWTPSPSSNRTTFSHEGFGHPLCRFQLDGYNITHKYLSRNDLYVALGFARVYSFLKLVNDLVPTIANSHNEFKYFVHFNGRNLLGQFQFMIRFR